MTLDEAAKLLRELHSKAKAKKEQAISGSLFGIIYADEIANLSIKEIVDKAGVPKGYMIEMGKGVKLAKYVQLRSEVATTFSL